ncbi:uncharacterized protein A4U43_C07F17120 [Asparagus officinalis]|uniref:VQ domain-containing protein n=1 Tax=Asparagus officinalis TaxID=4686 RepID=A0A5P1ECL4_ASPOF|nr:uncharacterized protein LOC109849052 [Asparagus officinalis]ONK63616.1 uncharacterized protein A4U43_C07F17120 [Asparagus officinalis]
MESLSVARKSPKQSRSKKKAIKVVYISNPMRIRASESDFRAVVQELTGQDSDIAELMANYEVQVESKERAPVESKEAHCAEMEMAIFDEGFALPTTLDVLSAGHDLMSPYHFHAYLDDANFRFDV